MSRFERFTDFVYNSNEKIRAALLLLVFIVCAPVVAVSTFHSVWLSTTSCGTASVFSTIHSFVISFMLASLSVAGVFITSWVMVGLTIPVQHSIRDISRWLASRTKLKETVPTPNRKITGDLFKILDPSYQLELNETNAPAISYFRLLLLRNTRWFASLALFAFPALSVFCLAEYAAIRNQCLVTSGAKASAFVTATVLALCALIYTMMLDGERAIREKAVLRMLSSVLSRIFRVPVLDLHKTLFDIAYNREEGSNQDSRYVPKEALKALPFGRTASDFTYRELYALDSVYAVERERQSTLWRTCLNMLVAYERMAQVSFADAEVSAIIGAEGGSVCVSRLYEGTGLLVNMVLPSTETLHTVAANVCIKAKGKALRIEMHIYSLHTSGPSASYSGCVVSKKARVSEILVYCAKAFVAVRPTLLGIEKMKFDENCDASS